MSSKKNSKALCSSFNIFAKMSRKGPTSKIEFIERKLI